MAFILSLGLVGWAGVLHGIETQRGFAFAKWEERSEMK
jgi:hypothetical protein